MLKKTIMSVFILLVTFMLAGVVSAQDFSIDHVEVDDILAADGTSIFVERDSTLLVEVFVEGEGSSDKVRVKAWIGGYEFGPIRDETEIFNVEDNVSYKKTLRLDIPDDLDSGEDYTLHVEVFDDSDSDELAFNIKVRIESPRHSIRFVDVFFRPGQGVEAGDNLFTVVRLENLGQKKEEDLKVTVSIPELGIFQSTFIDELVTEEDTNDDDEETSESTDEIILRIPNGVASGVYDVDVDVEYNRGRSTLGTTRTITIFGEDLTQEGTSVNIDKHLVELVPGERSNLMVTVSSGATAPYKVEVDGTELFATSVVSPSVMTVKEGKEGVFTITLNTLDDAVEGTNNFVVRVLSGNEIVEEFVLTGQVVSDEANVREGLVIGFIVLVVVLILLGLIIAFQRMRGPEDPEDASYY